MVMVVPVFNEEWWSLELIIMTYVYTSPPGLPHLASQLLFWVSIAMCVIIISVGESLETNTNEMEIILTRTAQFASSLHNENISTKAHDIPRLRVNGCSYE